jgi:hypothetical protein
MAPLPSTGPTAFRRSKDSLKDDVSFQAIARQPDATVHAGSGNCTSGHAAAGATYALKIWRGLLLDGHNRLDICQRLKLPYETIEVTLASRDHALLWIEENQLGRRNLSDDQRAAIALPVMRRKSDMAVRQRPSLAGEAGGRGRPKENSSSDTSTDKLLPQPAVSRVRRRQVNCGRASGLPAESFPLLLVSYN